MIRWSELSGYWELKDKKIFTSTINYHLLKCIGVTVICSIYSLKLSVHYPDILFDVQSAYRSMRERERERERERVSVCVYGQ